MEYDKIIKTIAMVIFMIFAMILVAQLLLKLTGHSPTETQLIYIAIGAILSYLFAINYKMGVFVGEIKGFMRATNNRLSRLEGDRKSRI